MMAQPLKHPQSQSVLELSANNIEFLAFNDSENFLKNLLHPGSDLPNKSLVVKMCVEQVQS